MSTENNSAAGATPAAMPTSTEITNPAAVLAGNAIPPAPAAATPAPAATPQAAPAGQEKDPEWLPKRLERERKSQLKALGFDSEDQAKAAAQKAKADAEADKTTATKLAEANARAEQEAAKATRALAVANEHAARMMVGLTEAQKSAIQSIAGDDPVAQLDAISKLSPTWAAAAQAAQAAATATAEAEAKAKAAAAADKPTVDTLPPAGAPSGIVPPPTTPRASYEQMRGVNPFEAATFGRANPSVYTPPKQ